MADHACCFDPSEGSDGGMECLEAEHWLVDPFEKTVVLLNDFVEMFGPNDTDDSTDSRDFSNTV